MFYYDPEFAHFVDNAQGKFLPLREEGGVDKVLISTRISPREQVRVYAHELRHACDRRRAVEGLPFRPDPRTTEFWHNWSEYRATKTDVEVEYWQEVRSRKGTVDDLDRLEIMGSIYGRRTGVFLANLMRKDTYRKEQIYFLVRYLAVQRKLGELLDREIGGAVPIFGGWNITPDFIRREYGDLTELCDLWDGLETCELTAAAPCFTRLWRRLLYRCRKLADELLREEEERKRLEEERREAEIREIMEEIRPDMGGSTLMNAIWEAKLREGRPEEVEAEQEAFLRDMAEYELARRKEEAQRAELFGAWREEDLFGEPEDFEDTFGEPEDFDDVENLEDFEDFEDFEDPCASGMAS